VVRQKGGQGRGHVTPAVMYCGCGLAVLTNFMPLANRSYLPGFRVIQFSTLLM
jgi:hypothetical protein